MYPYRLLSENPVLLDNKFLDSKFLDLALTFKFWVKCWFINLYSRDGELYSEFFLSRIFNLSE